MEFKKRLKALRILHGYTQEQLAEKLSLSKANISKYESGIIEPNLKTLELLSKTFHCTVTYLLDLEGECDYEYPLKPVKERILDMMRENDLSKEDFAKIAGVKPVIVDYWLNGELPICDSQLIKIYDYFTEMYPKTKKYPLYYLFEPNDDCYSEQEKKLVFSYRNTPEMQQSVDKLLGIDTPQGINIGEDIAETVKKTQQSADIKCNSRSE